MKLTCIHCGKPFAITAEQLGKQGRCPHCRGNIQLPKAVDEEPTDGGATAPAKHVHWWHNSISALVSIALHLTFFVLAGLVGYTTKSDDGLGEEVRIGLLPSEQLDDGEEEKLDADQPVDEQPRAVEELLDVQPPIDVTSDTALDVELDQLTPSAGGSDSGSFDLGSVSLAGGSMAGGSWDGMLQNLRRNGLDIVITFDSTGSMQGEIRQVKKQIRRIGNALVKLVPKSRIGICTYRDRTDRYVVRGLPLTSDVGKIEDFLYSVSAGGGGDHPEAVREGLEWVMDNNEFRPRARKVILLFGDAPPHAEHHRTCLQIASDFYGQQRGVLSTVTCRSNRKLPEFVQLAEVGGGEAFLTADEQQIMTQLMILVFGSRHREKVLEAFKLLEE